MTPEIGSQVHEGSIVTILFDSPVSQDAGVVYLGNSVSITSTPVSLSSVQGLMATFVIPSMTEGRLYLHVPSNAVKSVENDQNNEEYRFSTNSFWTFAEGTFT